MQAHSPAEKTFLQRREKIFKFGLSIYKIMKSFSIVTLKLRTKKTSIHTKIVILFLVRLWNSTHFCDGIVKNMVLNTENGT